MLAFLKFDDEDTYYSPEDGLDDVSKWLSEIMTETGIRGTLCVMGARADLLKERGREDVLEAMAKHEIVSHQMANVHPDLVTILSDKEWDDGVEAMREYEDRVAEIFRRAFGRDPQGLSQHNVQWGPQHAALAADMGVPRLSIPIGVPGTEQPCWYAGALNMPCHMYDLNQGPKLASSGTIEITPEFGIGDSLYSCDDEFEKRFAQLKEYVDACVDRGVEFIHLFGCHPSRIWHAVSWKAVAWQAAKAVRRKRSAFYTALTMPKPKNAQKRTLGGIANSSATIPASNVWARRKWQKRLAANPTILRAMR
jgi:hypothetical protein